MDFEFERPLFKRPRYFSHVGSRMQDTYQIKFDKDGKKDLVKSGQKDIYEEIQSYKDSVDVNTILARYAAGELGVLEKGQGLYIDNTIFKEMDVPGLLNFGQQVTEAFMHLPAEEREKFGNDPMQYITAMVRQSKETGDDYIDHSEVLASKEKEVVNDVE